MNLRALLAPIASVLIATSSLASDAQGTDLISWSNPLVQQRADPHVALQSDNYYYFTTTVPEYDCIELRRARTLGGLATAEPKVI